MIHSLKSDWVICSGRAAQTAALMLTSMKGGSLEK